MFVCCTKLVYAEVGVIINEVQVGPTGERFIELYNSGGTQNLTGWSIKRRTASGKEYSLVSMSRLENKTIASNDYFLLTNEGSYTGSITSDATWASSNDIAKDNTIFLYNKTDISPVSKVGWGIVTDCGLDCALNPTDGLSIQRNSGGDWIIASRTPGYLNSESESMQEEVLDENNNDISDTGSSSKTSSSSSSSTPKEIPIILKITTKIISPKTVIAGIPFSINSLTTTNRGQTYLTGKFVWNFGDGNVSELRKGLPFEYTYEYPGDYALNLTYFESYLSESSGASDRIIIKVVPSEVYINGVGDVLDPFVEIGNKSSNEIFLSNWIITAGIHYFVIPEGTTLLPSKKVKLSPKITGFTGEDIGFVTISNPNKIITATYPNIIEKKFVPKSSPINGNNTSAIEKVTQDNLLTNNSQIINLNELGASAGDSGIKVSKLAYSIIGLFVIIGLGIMSFILIKKKDKAKDYLEKEIRAEDMTIIE